MTVDAGAWCPSCGVHRIDDKRTHCPTCTDRVRKDAEAAAALLGWRVFGTGGRA